MDIKFDELDMLDFFENEPIIVGEIEAGEFIYSLKDSQMFSITLTVDVYMQRINVSISYGNNIVFAGQFENIIEIKKSDNVLLAEMENKKRLVIKKSPCLGIIIEG